MNFGCCALAEMDERAPWGKREIAGCFENVTLSTSDITSGRPYFIELCICLFSTFLQGSQLFMVPCQLSVCCTVWGGDQQVSKTRSRNMRGEDRLQQALVMGHMRGYMLLRATWKASSLQRGLGSAAWGDTRKWNSCLGFCWRLLP